MFKKLMAAGSALFACAILPVQLRASEPFSSFGKGRCRSLRAKRDAACCVLLVIGRGGRSKQRPYKTYGHALNQPQ